MRMLVRVERPLANLAVAAAVAIAGVALVASVWQHQPARLGWTPIPAGARAALDRCRGNLYNLYDNGGAIEWFAPATPTFIDSRQDPFPSSIVRAQIDAESTGAYESLFARYEIGCVALPPASRVARRLDPGRWELMYADAAWRVLRRRSAGSDRAGATPLDGQADPIVAKTAAASAAGIAECGRIGCSLNVQGPGKTRSSLGVPVAATASTGAVRVRMTDLDPLNTGRQPSAVSCPTAGHSRGNQTKSGFMLSTARTPSGVPA
jgi:hypothetical protein